MPTDPPAYGATFADVKVYVPGRRWTAESPPTQGDVEAMVTSIAAQVEARIGPLEAVPDVLIADAVDGSTVRGRLTGLAKRAVVLGAAAHAEAAAHPERARPNDTSTYAAWLWARFLEAFDEAGTYADDVAPGELPAGVEPGVVEPAWSFPDPVGWADRGI